MRSGFRFLLPALLLALTPLPAWAEHTPDEVLIVANGNSPDSLDIAHFYQRHRGIPPDHLVVLDCSESEIVSREEFDRTIHDPLLRRLRGTDLGDQIQFIVTTKGVPLRISGPSAASPELDTRASVDSDLTLLRWEALDPRHAAPREGPLINPYFNADPGLAGIAPFTTRRWPIYLVTRLTGFTAEDARGLVTRADTPSPPGVFAVDLRDEPQLPGADDLLTATARRLQAMGCHVSVEDTVAVLAGVSGLSGYASWGSNDPHRTDRRFDLGFLPGAIACPLVSTDARTFAAPPADWNLVGWEDREHFYAGSPQTLTGDLIAAGVTGVSGNVAEPTLAATARPDIALPAYAAGYTLAEAFYQALPGLSWQAVIVGDPLCRLPAR
jgi:uncharacterized protein (TIGR03790 family)